MRAVLLVIGMVTWYSLTYQLLPVHARKRLRWVRIVIYILGGVTAAMLFGTPDVFVGERENLLWVGRMGVGLPYIVYGFSRCWPVAG